LVALGVAAGIATTVSGRQQSAVGAVGRAPSPAANVTTTADGTVIARSVDRRRGLAFEVSTSTRYGRSSGLSVWLADLPTDVVNG
jgi:hypothetical protein